MPVQSFGWEGPLAIQEVAIQLKTALFGPIARKAGPEAIRAEIIRVALWEQSVLRQAGTLSDASTLTQQLLRRARMLWTPFQDATLQSEIQDNTIAKDERPDEDNLDRQTLSMLAEQGDLFALPQGHWLPAPVRLVPATNELYLLVGGMPSSLLPETVLNALHLHGNFRQIDATIVQANPVLSKEHQHWQFQTLEHWLGAAPTDFQKLLIRFRNIKMEEIAHQDSSPDIMAYNASINKPQWLRWQPLEHISVDGRYLLREKRLWGKISYSIGEIQNRRIKKQSHLLEAMDIRRLCYALDADANVPTKAIWKKEKGQRLLSLSTELPALERKQLAILGQLQQKGLNYYPRIWQFPLRHEVKIKELLAQLGITME